MNVQEKLLKERIDPHLIPEKLALLASRATGESLSVAGFRSLSGGCWNRVLAVDFDEERPPLVFKISPNQQDEKVINEYQVHHRFSQLEMMNTPQPYLLDTSSKLIPGTVFVMQYIPGQVMHSCFGLFGDADRRRIIETIAGDAAELHRIREPGFGSSALPAAERFLRWPDFWLPRFDNVVADARESGLVERTFLERTDVVRRQFDPVLDIGPTGTLTHYDIWSGNVMIDTDADGRPQVAGYIDISGLFADYARELSFAELFGIADGTFYRRYQKVHEIDPGFRLRASIYNLKMSLRHIMMYPSEGYYRRIAAECLALIEAEL